MKHLTLLCALCATQALLSSTVLADEIVITYRSGKTQTIRVEPGSDPVEQISIRKGAEAAPKTELKATAPVPPSSPPVVTPPAQQAAPSAAGKQTAPEQRQEKDGVKIRWAAPRDANY